MTKMEYEIYEINEISPNLNRTRSETQKNQNTSGRKWIVWTAFAVVWAALLFGSFSLAQHYIHGIQMQLNEIQQSNQKNVADLNKTIAGLQTQLNQNKQDAELLQKQFQDVESQLEAVKEEMALAGSSLSSSDETKKALSQRITDLSKELKTLQASIKKLEEAARVY